MLIGNWTRRTVSLVVGLLCCLTLVRGDEEKVYDEEAGREYLKKINADIQVKTTESVRASWGYESNITDENLRVQVGRWAFLRLPEWQKVNFRTNDTFQLDVSAKLANYTKEIWKETIKFPWKSFKDPDVRRQFQKFSVLGTAILSPPKYERFNKIISDMQSIYGKAKICNYTNTTDCSLQLEPELTEIFVKSRDPDELLYYWEQWRNAAGKPVRAMYKEYVDLSNEAAVLNNFTNNAEFWLKDYEAKDFKQQVEGLWQQLRPLYLQLHAYVRRRLREQYGEKHVTKRGPIPAHLLGNMWAQSWGNVFDFTAPYPDKPSMDVTPNMVEQGYTPLRMFKLAEEFFTSLNLSPMPETFWKNSILEKPNDGRDLICHASAWDFYDGKDFRIKQCTRITMEDLNTVHHEMGHIQYFLQYKTQPLVYKEGTNPGFHEAVGDVMALSVSTPKHLRKIGLLNATEDDSESEINQLYNMALDKIAFLPFGYLMDQWRWSVFEGKTTERDYNCKWWQLREKYQGLSPSVARSESDFDPGAKYHTVGNVPYIRYFVSFVIQFQFHRSLCIAAGEFNPDDPASKPLHKCDIYQSKEAGELLKKMLQMGSSKPWPDAMEVITGQRDMDARALLDYFGALHEWLEEENKRTGEFIGWESSQTECECEEEGQRATPVDTQGNFEDGNIAYSYAEFVRQDDNTFGFPDYLEEVQPSYHALRPRSKENEFQANYFIPKSPARKFTSKQNIYIADDSYGQDQNNFIDVSRLQRLKNSWKNSLKLPDKERYKLWKFSRPELGTFDKKPMSQDTGNALIIDTILKDVKELEKSLIAPLTKEEAYKWVASRDLGKEKKTTDTSENVQEEIQVESQKQQLTASETNKTEESSNDEPEKSTESSVQDSRALKNNAQKFDSRIQAEAKAEDMSSLTSKVKGKAECILETAKKFSSKSLDNQMPNELLWKAELVKNEAEQMLKDFNLTSSSPNHNINYSRWLFHPPRPSESENYKTEISPLCLSHKKARNIFPLYTNPGTFKQGNPLRLTLNSNDQKLLNPSKLFSRSNAQDQKHLHFREYDLVDVIPLDDLLGESNRKLKGKRSSLQDDDDFAYVILVGKLSDTQLQNPPAEKELRKKSYKEYHYNIRNPVIYNSVTINPPGGKPDRGEEWKEHWSRVSYGSSGVMEGKNERQEGNSNLRAERKGRRDVFTNKFSRHKRDYDGFHDFEGEGRRGDYLRVVRSCSLKNERDKLKLFLSTQD